MKPFISVCIPAYKRPDSLKRLLDSISIQTFKEVEIIVSDDSPDNSVQDLLHSYTDSFPILYKKNSLPLGTPANWNAAISLASGTWIKIMHDDDWFAQADSLELFAKTAHETACDFIFSGFFNVDIENGAAEKNIISDLNEFLIKRSPYSILRKNYIGHPSTTMIRKGLDYTYNEQLKWVVDIEFYIRILLGIRKFEAIKIPLVNLGISSSQVTKQVFRNPAVEIPENIYLLNKIGSAALLNIFAYDYFWRFLRNLSVRNAETLSQYGSSNETPPILLQMLVFQKSIPFSFLKSGVVSKTAMLLSYTYSLLTFKMKK